MMPEDVQDTMERLFAGREPSEQQLARCATLDQWRLEVHEVGIKRRGICINGTLRSSRFQVKNQPPPFVRVLWIDRKLRFVVTKEGMWNLGEQEKVSDDG